MEETREISEWLPASPGDEDERTLSKIPEGTSSPEVERVFEAVNGRVNVIGGQMLRDSPVGHSKAGILQVFCAWSPEYARWAKKDGGTGGTSQNGDFLSPDIAAWRIKERPFDLSNHSYEHLYSRTPAPHWILDLNGDNDVCSNEKGR